MIATLAGHRRAATVSAILALVAALALAVSLLSAKGEQPFATSTPTGPMELPDEWMTAQRMSDGSTELSAATYAKARAEPR